MDRSLSDIMSFISRGTSAVGIPFDFFQSRAEIRTWGETEVADPSVQPRPENAPIDFGTGLPGYPRESCLHLDVTKDRTKGPIKFVNLFTLLGVRDDKLLGPRRGSFSMCKVQYPPLPAEKLGTPSYNYQEFPSYRMDYHPYVNAVMHPQNPTRMYVRANQMTAYPYGVPAVEEYEMAEQVESAGGFFC